MKTFRLDLRPRPASAKAGGSRPVTPARARTRAGRQSGVWADLFKARYLRSLEDYRFFYDDVDEIGRPDDAEHVFYFVPGINGTPGQMRFLLPSLTRVFGHKIYLKALHLPEFSARRPIWEKYSVTNVERKLAQLRTDLADLLARFERISVACSSNGFYDFAAAVGGLPRPLHAGRLHVMWGACAPDNFEPTPWEKFFSPLNGFEHAGHRWFAYPNHNALKVFNPETTMLHRWRDGHQQRLFHKHDLESRFHCCGLEWDYVSTDQLGAMVRHVAEKVTSPWNEPAEAVVAANDGYWQGMSEGEITRAIRRYLPRGHVVFKPASHLWVANPTYMTELFERHKTQVPALRR
jgi:hypothetical protein